MKKLFLGALLLMTFAASGAATRSSSEKMQVVYREQLSGEWQVFVFGPVCPIKTMHMHLIAPDDPTVDPIKIQCTYK